MANDDESSDMGEIWREIRKDGQEKRDRNRVASTEWLAAAGVPFESRNQGRHLIVAGAVDYWPGTGLWHQRKGPRKGRGIRSLMRFVQQVLEQQNGT